MPSPWYYASMHGYTGVAFVGCVHTVTPDLVARLDRLLEYTDAFENFALVFGGDLSSSKLLDDMKKHFYDAKRHIGWEMSEFLNLVENSGGFSTTESRDTFAGRVFEEEYIGPWIGKYGSDALRKAIEQGFIDNTEAICEMAKKFRDRGARVMVCGGNWEDVECSRATMGMPNIPDHIPPLREMGVEVFTEIGHARIGNVDLVFLPYWELSRSEMSVLMEDAIHRFGIAFSQCNVDDNAVIAVAHAEPNWAVHNQMNPVTTPKREELIASLGFFLALLRPDQVVYPHQHDPIKSTDGHVLGDNVKYLLRIESKPMMSVSLIEDPKTVERPVSDVIVASFIPFQKIGLLTTEDTPDQRPEILGGNGMLIEVLSI